MKLINFKINILLYLFFFLKTIFKMIDCEKFNNNLEKINLSNEKSKFYNSKKYKKNKISKTKSKEKSKNQKKPEKKSRIKDNSSFKDIAPNLTSQIQGNNQTILNYTYNSLNQTFDTKDFYNFKKDIKKYDFKLLNKDLEQIFQVMLLKNENRLNTNGVRDFIHFFMNSYNNCDKDKDNILNLSEFKDCIKSDKYLQQIIPSATMKLNKLFSNKPEDNDFLQRLFKILDSKTSNFIDFNEYMYLRLFAFSWKKCSVYSPFLDESDFECALEISSGYKTLTRTLTRKIFELSLELTDNLGNRGIDFVSFVNIIDSLRLYSNINAKRNEDITRDEFNNALDTSVLPLRYNQKIVYQMMEIMQENDKPNQGIDILSFIFNDFFLKLFFEIGKERPYFLSREELRNVFDHPLFPNRTLTKIIEIPQFEFTADSYQMYQYYNISNFNSEDNYLYKSFIEVSNENSNNEKKNNLRTNNKIKISNSLENKKNTIGKKVNSELNNQENFEKFGNNKNGWSDFDVDMFSNKVAQNLNLPLFKNGKNNFNISLNTNITIDKIFTSLDRDYTGYVDFKSFINFIQVASLFAREDTYDKGKLPSNKLYELYSNYADYPVINYKTRQNSKRFNYFQLNQQIDPLDAYLILYIDDIAKYFFRNDDDQTLNEIETKKFLTKMNMKYIPDAYLNKCLRGIDENDLPKYEWECCFVQGMTLNLKFYDGIENYLTAKINGIPLTNTAFYNVENQYLN
jgi:hypothetical protein